MLVTERFLAQLNVVFLVLVIAGIGWLNFRYDPYCVFEGEACRLSPTTKTIDPFAWLMADLQGSLATTIILGNSRVDEWCVKGNGSVSNLGVGAASLDEMLSLWEFARGQIAVKRVIIGLDLPDLNSFLKRNRFPASKLFREQSFSYLFRPKTTLATWSELRATAQRGDEPPHILAPAEWESHLTAATQAYFRNFSFYQDGFERLRESVESDVARGVQVDILLLPGHSSYWDRVGQLGFISTYDSVVTDLRELLGATLHDFRFLGSEGDQLFRDALHPTPGFIQLVEGLLFDPGTCAG